MDRIERVVMTDYDQVRELADFSYIAPNGSQGKLTMHRSTFRRLTDGSWDNDELGEPTKYQNDFKAALVSTVKSGYIEWFDTSANDIMRSRALGVS